MNTVHLVVSDLYNGDAIGNYVLAIHKQLQQSGIAVKLYAERFDTSLAGVQSYAAFFSAFCPDDTLVYQLSNHDPAFKALMDTPCRKIIYYHNITPGHYFAPYSPETARLLDQGRHELPLLAKADVILANSHYSMDEVRPFAKPATPLHVLPPCLAKTGSHTSDKAEHSPVTLPTFGPKLGPKSTPESTPYLLMLGRLAPHKQIEKAFPIFANIHKSMPAMKLVIVGSHFEPYALFVQQELQKFPEIMPFVTITGKLTHEQVQAYLHNATALLQTSAHEGFCMPLLEAMQAGILVFANSSAAMPQTLGNANTCLDMENVDSASRAILELLADPVKVQDVLQKQQARAKTLLDKACPAKLLSIFLTGC